MLVYTQDGNAFNLDSVCTVVLYDNKQEWEVLISFNSPKMINIVVYEGTKEQCQHILTWLVGKSKNPNYGTGDALRSDYLTFYK